jgi:hypothetical protein
MSLKNTLKPEEEEEMDYKGIISGITNKVYILMNRCCSSTYEK